ncbi:MAG TPA: CarD family transcriptional regulator [Anaeromyxobacter sp.]|nr:CarD family transcriptional regulator [Anaeromyxobacter sp.]
MRGPPHRHPDEPREVFPAVEGVITDADELKVGDRVVYPNQGVCAVAGFKEMEVSGTKLQFVTVKREEDGALVHVARNKVPSIGLRRVASADQMEGVFHYLAAQFDDPELDWKVRHRDNADRLIAGGVLGVAEVVKGLHSLSRIRPLPTKEREQYDNARHLLVHEIAVSLNVPPVLAEDYVDYALMPPAGVTFKLKPPPAPVLLPSRPKKRRPAAEEDELGLGDLGLDLDLEGALAGAPAGEGEEAEGAEKAEGAEARGAEAEGEGEEAGVAAPRAGAAKPEKHAKAAGAKPAKPAPAKAARKAKEKPAKKPAARKAAPKKPAAKPAAKRGGKKR